MVTIVKHEWHQLDRQYCLEFDEDLLSQIYPDLDEDEIAEKLQQIADGEIDVEDVVIDAQDNDIDLEWEHQYDDCWTDRKGGYDVTFELGDEDSYHTAPEPALPTHKCTKCRWTGNRWEAGTQYCREDGTVIEDYFGSDEESHHEKHICPMCDSDTELTEEGVKDEQERKEREARWAKELEDLDDE